MGQQSRSKAAIAALGVGVAGAVVATQVARRRRARAVELPVVSGGEHLKVDTSDGAVLGVHVVGDGPTVVLAHGWTNTMSTWEPVAAELVERGYRVVRYDQRGHGASTCGSVVDTISRLGTDLAELLIALDLRDVVVMGHSMGGMATQAFAIEHPDVVADRVTGLVLVATLGDGLGRMPFARIAPMVVGSPLVSRAMAGRRGLMIVRGAHGRRPNPLTVAATRDLFISTSPDVRASQLRAMYAMDLSAGHASITVPTTVVIGSRDTLCPPALGRRIATGIPNAQLVELKAAGHMLPYEAPDTLADIVVEHHHASVAS